MKKKLISGLSWLGLLRVLGQLLTFTKLAVLARVLTPEHFGVFALVTTTINSLEALSETGFNYAAIYYRDSFRKYAPSLFLINLIRGLLLFLLILVLAFPVGAFFSDPTVTSILVLTSVIPFIKGFTNPYTILFHKDQKFKKEFAFRIIPIFISSISTIYFGLVFKNVEGLAFGLLLGTISEVLVSYILIRGKVLEKPNFKIIKKLFSYGKWMSLGGIFAFMNSQIDNIIVGKLFGAYTLGLYDIAYKLATIVTSEISDTLSKILFPYFSSIQKDKRKIRQNYLSIVLLISIPAMFSLIIFTLFPNEIISFVFGDMWIGAARILPILAIYGFFRTIIGPAGPLFLAGGKPHILTNVSIINFLLIIATIIPLSIIYGLEGVAYGMTISYLLISLIFFILVKSNFANEKS